MTARLREAGDSGELQPPGEVLEVAVTQEGIVVQLNTLQTSGEHRLSTQPGERVVLQLQPLQRLQTSESLVPAT